MEFLDQQINPPASWEKFEELSRALLARLWNDPLTARHGRAGQKQHGVDIHGHRPSEPGKTLGAQCKGKDGRYGHKVTTSEFDAELRKAEKFTPGLSHWALLTSAPDDAVLQAHALTVSEARVAAGAFPVVALGWGNILSLLAQYPEIVEQFYPELGPQLPALIKQLSALSGELRVALDATGRLAPSQTHEAPAWIEEQFDTVRDLGPALLGRPLGPADVAACPELPQVERLWHDLKASYTARLAGTPGAGKSVCALQVAKRAHDRGWRVLRLRDPNVASLPILEDEQPTLHIIDDAHLTDPALLREAEQGCTATRWLLSAHTVSDDKAALSGTIRINPEQAVAVIAAGLRADLDETRRVVERVDDRIGLSIGNEYIEDRLDQAEQAERPWQFCFILGGGWRRARQSTEDAKAAQADLVLAAAAIHQLASRDARVSAAKLEPLFAATGTNPSNWQSAIDWLIAQRLLLAPDDLRCPHQRLSVVLIARILESQDAAGRAGIAAILNHVIASPAFPLAGLSLLLTELRMMGHPMIWTHLVDEALLPALIARCWKADEAADRRGAAWLLSELRCYLTDWVHAATTGYEEVAAHWFSEPVPGTGYAVGHLFGQFGMKDEKLTASLIARTDPVRVAAAFSQTDAILASEVGAMIHSCSGYRPDDWKSAFLAAIDRSSCRLMIKHWPLDHYLSAADNYLRLLIWDDQDFGLDLVEAFIPVIANKLREKPFHSFHELQDLVWHGLRSTDVLGVYTGKNGPTPRMRAVARKLAACWAPNQLAEQFASVPARLIQPAGWLLYFLREVSKRQYLATLDLIDWIRVEQMIGEGWARMHHDLEVFLQLCFQAPSAQEPIRAMIARNLDAMDPLSVRLAMLAPEAAASQIEAGRMVGLSSHQHFHWRMSAAVVAQLADAHAELIDPMIAPHIAVASQQLSSKTQSFFDEPLHFLRLIWQVAPASFERIMAAISPASAEAGWGAALRSEDVARHDKSGERGQRANDQRTAAWLIERAIDRNDALGVISRRLRKRYPRRSLPPAELLEPFTEQTPNSA